MGQLGTQVAKDIKERFASSEFADKVGDKTGQIIQKSIKDQTRAGEDPSGTNFPYRNLRSKNYADFKQAVGANPIADLRSGGYQYPEGRRKPEAMDNLQFTPDENEVNFDFGSYGAAENYMADHQEGENGMPERRWFPEENKDADSNVQKQNAKEVEQVLEKFLNLPRTVHVKARPR